MLRGNVTQKSRPLPGTSRRHPAILAGLSYKQIFTRMEYLMDAWKASWEIIDEQVACRACGARQDVRDARRPFKHREGCAAAIQTEQMPWRDLATLLGWEL